jgi:hypothetical protein
MRGACEFAGFLDVAVELIRIFLKMRGAVPHIAFAAAGLPYFTRFPTRQMTGSEVRRIIHGDITRRSAG